MRNLYIVLLSVLITANVGNAQGEAAATFLLISPTTEASGMGEASVAIPMNDPLTSLRNPAQLGFQSANNYFSYSTNASNWLPDFNIPDLRYRTDGFSSGINFQNIFGDKFNLSFGYGYFHTYMDLGLFSRRGENNEDFGNFQAYEYANQWTVSTAIDYYLKLSVGFSYKAITALPMVSYNYNFWGGNAKAKDYGIILDIPLVRLSNNIFNTPQQIAPDIYYSAGISLGIAWQNIGDRFKTGLYDSDPLPRIGRVGMGLNISFDYRKENYSVQLLGFKWTVEASDMLIDHWREIRDQYGNLIKPAGWSYRGGLGDIKFFDEVILGHSNYRTERSRGWNLTLMEMINVRYGRLTDRMGNRHVSTYGIGFQLKGLSQIIKIIFPDIAKGPIQNFILNHLDFRYDQSTWSTTGTNDLLNNTKFEGFSFSIYK
ncbi:MAG: hypothetical protein HY964_09665 [Ignavibacteriales bacterium]|nr:hypothetical protein [Ignavibacteriales bacterium]